VDVARVWAVAVPLTLAAVTGCSLFDDDDAATPDDDTAAAEVETVGTYGVETQSLTLVDDSRPTPAYGGQPEQPQRTVVTDVWLPAGGDGSFPLIVFNHGQQGEPAQYAPSFERWASAGYVVAAPRHPLTVRGGPGAVFVDDMMGEIGDVPFVITAVAEELGERVDGDRVAVAGHSSGAIVAYAVGFNTCCHDDRVDAVLTEALIRLPFDEYAPELRGTPVLFVVGTADAQPSVDSQAAYDSSEAPRFLLGVEGGNHSAMYRDGPEAGPVADAALAFFDLSLKDDQDAVGVLQSLPGMQADPG
jgi:fermentation-respiration switch protein FrsA (DUF1100 family)